MDFTGTPFSHWDYRHIGDASLNTLSMTLLSRLLAEGQLRRPRAWLTQPATLPRLRQTLALTFDAPLVLSGQAQPCQGLWLVEQADRKVFCFATSQRPNPAQIGGRVVRDLALLDPAAPWVTDLAKQLAAQSLTSPAAGRAGPDRPSARWVLARVEATLLSAALSRFLAELDPEVLAAVRAEGDARAEVFNAYCGLPPTEQRNRLQAVTAYPWFAPVLRGDWSLRRAIAQGAPLTQTLAKHFQVKPSTITHLRALPGPVAPGTRMALLKQVDAVPVDYVPRSPGDWATFHELANPLIDLATLLQVDPPQLLKPFRGGWQAGRAALEAQAGAPLDLDAILAMMQAVYQFGVRPALQAAAPPGSADPAPPRQAPAAFYPLWFGRYGLGRLAAMTRHWRAGFARYSVRGLPTAAGEAAEAPRPLSWSPVLAGTHRRGPYRVLELTSQADLEQEGHCLGHCVGTYTANCLCWGSAVFSVRDRFGRSLSTFEVQLADSGPVLVQHKALGNREPPAAEQALVAAFLQGVLATVPRERFAAIRAERESLAAGAQARLEHLLVLDAEGAMTGELAPDTAAILATIVQPLHPAEARHEGVGPYLKRATPELLAAMATADTR